MEGDDEDEDVDGTLSKIYLRKLDREYTKFIIQRMFYLDVICTLCMYRRSIPSAFGKVHS